MASSQLVVLSPELIYGVRLVTLLAKVGKVLRSQFHQHFPTDPTKLYKEIKKHEKKLKVLLKQKVIRKSQYIILLPATGKTNSSEFDITLLIFALITICPIQTPITGWKSFPLPSDRSNGANFIRLRNDRNEIMHTYFEFEETRFTSIWGRIESSLEELGCDKKELRDLKSASLDPLLQADYEKKIADLKQALQHIADLEDSLKGVTYNVFSPTLSFVGRENEIMEVHQNLITKDEKHIALVMYGLGGIGKSELARQYCHRFALSYYKENVIWINAEDKSTMTEDFRNVAERIPLNTKDEYGKLLSIKTVVSKVYRFFDDRPVLFVFDNVINKKDLMEFIETKRSTNVSILITSQYTEWSERFIQFRTDVLSQNDAFALVSQNIDKKYTLSRNTITLLCDKLQYLPLALQQSIAYIKRWSITIDKYLEHFQKYADKILDTNQNDEMYNKTVKTTWNMALSKLKDEPNAKLAIALINFMSFLDGKNIKKELFYEYYDEYLVNEALQQLQKYSLIVITTFHDHLEQTILMHSLLQYVIRLESKQKHLEKFLDIIFRPLDNDCHIEHESYGKYWYYQLAYIFHQKANFNILALKISKYLPQLQIIFNSKGKIFLFHQILHHVLIFQKEKLGYNDLETLKTRRLIAQCLQSMGNNEEALHKGQEIEMSLSEIVGCYHPAILLTQHDIAIYLRENGNYDEAINKSQQVKKLQMEIFGNKPSETLIQNTIAICLMEKGNFGDALTIFQEAEKWQTETIGSKSPNTLILQHNIATSLWEIGSYDEALKKFQQVEKLETEIMGYKHPETLKTQHGLAMCLEEKGEYEEALNKYQEVEKLRTEVIGEKHPDTLRTQYKVAYCLEQMGNYKKALNKYHEVEKLQTEIMGYKYQDTLNTGHSIGNCLHNQGKYDEAINKFKEVEKLLTETVGYKHKSTLITRYKIAVCFHQKGNCDEALNKYQELEKLQTEARGFKHLDTLRTQYSIAICLLQKDKWAESLILLQKVGKLQTETVGFKHQETLRTQYSIAMICLLQTGECDESLTLLQRVEKLQIETIGYKHPDTLITQYCIAICLLQKDKWDESLTISQKVGKLQTETIGYKHPHTLKTQYNIAICLLQTGKCGESLSLLQKLEKLQIETIGYKHPDTLTTRRDIVTCLTIKGKFDEALTIFQEVKRLEIETFGLEDPKTLKIQYDIVLYLFNIWQTKMKR